MLTILGNKQRTFCDQLSRRNFLRIGALGTGGFCLSDLLRAESLSNVTSSDKSVIIVYLPGGPTQHETFDPKPQAPENIRGAFAPISTRVPGIQFCELLPELSCLADRFSVVRSLTGMKGGHESFQCYAGRRGGRPQDNNPEGGWPTLGSVVSAIQEPVVRGVPPYVDVSAKMGHAPYNNSGVHDSSEAIRSWPGFTGPQHTPLALDGGNSTPDIVLPKVNPSRLEDRRLLNEGLNRLHQRVATDGLAKYQRQAYDILTSNRLAAAMDLDQESQDLRARYGEAQQTYPGFGGAPQDPQDLLLARRFIEAGARCVTVAFGAWDWHANREGPIDQLAKKYLPVFDHAMSVFLQDLDERGLSENVMVVVWGEFGRTPRINAKGGRDHWTTTQSVLMAGGGIQGGRVIGQTDKIGSEPMDRPVHVQEVFATMYRHLGIDVNTVTLTDLSGRPQRLVDANRQPVDDLF